MDGAEEDGRVFLMSTPVIRLVTCGSVDDGKSTLIGRLLVETDSVPHDTINTTKKVRRSGSTIPAGEIDFSLLTDGLEAEREQGITIDVAYRSMSLLNGERLIISDAPGHEQYTRNMVVIMKIRWRRRRRKGISDEYSRNSACYLWQRR